MIRAAENPVAVTPDTARRNTARRRWWTLAMAVSAGAALWFGEALHERVTSTWTVRHVVPGFAPEAFHETVYAPDRTRIVVAHAGQCKVLDLAIGREISRLAPYDGRGVSDVSVDGRIVSRLPGPTSGDREVWLWDAMTGDRVRRLSVPERIPIEGWCRPIFCPDNRHIVATCADGLLVWGPSGSAPIGHIQIAWNKEAWRNFQLWNPLTREMTAADADGRLLAIDLVRGTVKPVLPQQPKPAKAADWSPDGTRLVTVDRDDGAATVWDVRTGKVVTRLGAEFASAAAFSADGRRIVTFQKRSDVRHARPTTSVWDRRTEIWDAASGRRIVELPTTAIVTLAPDWAFWAEAGPEGVRIARFDGSEPCAFPRWFDGHGSDVAFFHEDSHLAYVDRSGLVVVWQRREPIRSWLQWLTLYEFWLAGLAAIALAWSGWRLNKSEDACGSGQLVPEAPAGE